jgi:hypothetical protein
VNERVERLFVSGNKVNERLYRALRIFLADCSTGKLFSENSTGYETRVLTFLDGLDCFDQVVNKVLEIAQRVRDTSSFVDSC